MPAVDDPFSISASLPGQLKTVRDQIKDLASNNTQAASQALAAASAAATAAYNAAVTAAVGHGTATSFTLSTTPAELTRATITVPAGFTQALVLGIASATVVNQNNSSADFVRGYVDIAGVSAPVSGGNMVNPISAVTVTVSYSSLITGLTGGSTFYVRCIYYNELGNTGVTSARNICNLDAMVTFLR